jgi:hypothetical protein
MRGCLGLLALGALIGSVSACSGNSSSSTSASSPSPSSTASPLASADFCSLAADAVEGAFDFTNESSVGALLQDPSLTERQRLLMANAVADAVRQITAGGSFANDMLVDAVNEICGLQVPPVTMTQ